MTPSRSEERILGSSSSASSSSASSASTSFAMSSSSSSTSSLLWSPAAGKSNKPAGWKAPSKRNDESLATTASVASYEAEQEAKEENQEQDYRQASGLSSAAQRNNEQIEEKLQQTNSNNPVSNSDKRRQKQNNNNNNRAMLFNTQIPNDVRPAQRAHRFYASSGGGGGVPAHKAAHAAARSHTLKSSLILGLFVLGLLVCVTSLACLLLLPHFVSQQIGRKLVLKNGSMLLERWSKPNVPMYFKVWLFNVKNGQELVAKRGTRPQVEEIGPFVFNLKRQKDVISISGDNLYYTERKIYKFNRELSCCAINTTVTIPNIPLVAVVDRALGYQLPLVGRFIPRLVNRAIQSLREPMFVRKQVREILFDGYDVELLKMVSRIGSLVGLPQQSQRFALLKGRNDTWRPEQDGVWAINTGQQDRRLFGRVSSWNSYRKLPFWPGAQCNVINGSDGTLFPPPIRSSEPLYIFNQELCRTVNLVYDKPSDIRSIQAYRFVLNPLNFAHTQSAPASGGSGLSMLSNAQSANTQAQAEARAKAHKQQSEVSQAAAAAKANVEHHLTANLIPSEQEKLVLEAQRLAGEQHKHAPTKMNPQQCFCDRKTTNLNGVNVCEFDGLIDLSKCSKQAQVIFGSMPHFFNSDPRLLRQVDGMQPNASRHTTYLDIEPNTGLVLGGKRRVQLNLIVKRNNEIDGFENINDMLLPIVWFEESALIPDEAAKKFKSLYTDRIRLINLSLLSLFVASVALLAIDLRLMLATSYWRRQFKFATASLHHQQQQANEALPRLRRRRARQLSPGSSVDSQTNTISESDSEPTAGAEAQAREQSTDKTVIDKQRRQSSAGLLLVEANEPGLDDAHQWQQAVGQGDKLRSGAGWHAKQELK